MLALLLVAYLAVGSFFSVALRSHDYETEYLAVGESVVRGDLGLYDDELTGQWAPLPFYVYGVTQVLFGPSLLAPRALSLMMGALVLLLLVAIATRAGGIVAGSMAGALFCSHGVVLAYFCSVHFAGLSALLHLMVAYLLFCTRWRHRHVLAMAAASVLFFVKPNYWPTIPFVLGYVLWRAPSVRERLLLVVVAVAPPVVFFAANAEHLKLLAYVPIARRWVEPLGYYPLHALLEDPAALSASDYFETSWGTSLGGTAIQVLRAVPFLLKRYAVWAGLAVVLSLMAWLPSPRAPVSHHHDQGALIRFALALSLYLVALQFVILGSYSKQAVGYVGAIAPLLAIVIGWCAAEAWERWSEVPPMRAAILALVAAGIFVSPWVHRPPNLARHASLANATVPQLDSVARRLAALIPSGERRTFLLGDSLVLHLARRPGYVRQSTQWWVVFTSSNDRRRYLRVGMWGGAELEQWLGHDAQYAVVRTRELQFYRNRKPYVKILERMDRLLAEHFTLIAAIDMPPVDKILVYRRTSGSALSGGDQPAAADHAQARFARPRLDLRKEPQRCVHRGGGERETSS